MKLLLNMIVKNETANIERCLRSILPHPFICGGVIADTGSTDNTIDLILQLFANYNKPIRIAETTFENFSQARNFALRTARSVDIDYDYLLFADADHELIVTGKLPLLTERAYALQQRTPFVTYWNVRLIRHDLDCEYVGVTHECILPGEPPHALENMHYVDYETGANRTDKYKRDIQLLTDDIKRDPLNTRSVFYLIQSLQGAEMIQRAYEMAGLFLQMQGSLPEEQYWARYERGAYAETLGLPAEPEYVAAYELRPHRAEPLVRLAQLLRKAGKAHTALLYARQAAMLPLPANEVLPVATATYEWMALDEWLVCAAQANNLIEARVAARKLRKRQIATEERARILRNCDSVLGGKVKSVESTTMSERTSQGDSITVPK